MTAHTILIADDEPCITFMLASRLSERGHTVYTAADGDEALALAVARSPRAIVTDYQMPRMNGLELAHALRRDPRTADIPVIMLTARGHKLSPTELRATNIRQVMSKPFSARELVATLDELFEEALSGDRASHVMPDPARRAAA